MKDTVVSRESSIADEQQDAGHSKCKLEVSTSRDSEITEEGFPENSLIQVGAMSQSTLKSD